ncbi:vitamin K-dependent protein C-like isoform X2 [Tigriopus californicus]|uniref:vitamin K-dependent protein C-like isoform X2 n=1 Tax=Tigriopus californicus TaxID=6832 RepID=UPI0027DAAD63|nr:vitamin K-dependent protein C-like isoform X2 [Tigriopus californicus]XP_059086453.1 vitamin K-dependent protein C-like isoform X2 [Tigriopus californicus]XP_059086454.1 vitamin K-dependent protein C-like isoform X2 [Tigriopus californicus]XP_059086455.1 vitamin K-dependent protein C-like isoform X2 [Tigriopus californicus]
MSFSEAMAKGLLYFLLCFGCAQAVIKECWTLKSKPKDIRSPLCKNPSSKSAILFGNYLNKSTWPITPIGASPNPDQDAHCGIENAPSEEIRGRIVCGQEALPHRFPWMAAIYQDDTFLCGSSIISKDWILTAAHCVEDLQHEIHLRVGAHDLSKPEKTALTVAIKKENVISHPEYNNKNLNNDIALLELLNPLVFNETVRAVCLADARNRERDLVGYKTTVTGWGPLVP